MYELIHHSGDSFRATTEGKSAPIMSSCIPIAFKYGICPIRVCKSQVSITKTRYDIRIDIESRA
jgi:hypothetical protein